MAPRKTIAVRPVIEMINKAIAIAKTKEARQALCFVAEQVLMESNNYRGFMYLPEYHSDLYEEEQYGRHYYLPVGEF